MKRFALLVFVCIALLTSCSIDDDPSNNFYLEVLPIDSVVVPEHFVHGEHYDISITYTKPNSCYHFNDFIYEIDGHERTVAIVNTVYSNVECDEIPESVTVSFDFMVSGTETYVFKFYQGEDEDGVDQYYLVEIPVVDGRMNTDGEERN